MTNIAVLGSRYQQLIAHHYINPKYGLDPEIYVRISYAETYTGIYLGPIGHVPKVDRLTTEPIGIHSTLQAFCPIFSHLTINTDYAYDIELLARVAQTVNTYCSKTLQQIIIQYPYNASGLNLSFQNAQYVEIYSVDRMNATEVDAMFPRMEKLVIHFNRLIDLNGHFPHLIHLEVNGNCDNPFDLQAFSEQNPQIRELKADFAWNPKHLEHVNGFFPDLECLHVVFKQSHVTPLASLTESLYSKVGSLWSRKPNKSNTIHFRNVKVFTLDIFLIPFNKSDWIHDGQRLIEFDQLKTFKLRSYFKQSEISKEEQIDLITEYKGVNNVDFSSVELSYEQMRRLVDGLPELEAITLKCEQTEAVDDILRLMQNTKLESITIVVCEWTRKLFLAMKSLPEHWWQIDDDRSSKVMTLAFKRIKIND